jgi:mannose-6-phosphate isomerase-like protein (cupin superfamily)
MKCGVGLIVFVLCGFLTAAAQVLPRSNGFCSVSSSGLMGCSWVSAVPIGKADKRTPNPQIPAEGRGLFVSRFRLAPGAPLNRMVKGYDELIIGLGDGELVNETKSPTARVEVRLGSVVLMPKEEAYALRNVGKGELEVLVVQMR